MKNWTKVISAQKLFYQDSYRHEFQEILPGSQRRPGKRSGIVASISLAQPSMACVGFSQFGNQLAVCSLVLSDSELRDTGRISEDE